MRPSLCAFALASLLAVIASAQINLATQSKNPDFAAFPFTRPISVGATAPATCQIGQLFFNTSQPAGSNLFGCTAANTWAQLGGGTAGQIFSSQLADLVTTDTPTSITVAAGTFKSGTAVYSTPTVTFTAQTYTVSNASNTSPIVLTVSGVAGLHNGDSIPVQNVGGNTAANGTWTIAIDSGTQIELLGSTGNGAYSGGGTIGGTGQPGSNGVIYIEGTHDGNIGLWASASAGLILTCSGMCTPNQMTAPAFDHDATQISIVTVSAGNFGAINPQRAFLGTGEDVTAGLGIAITYLGSGASVAVDSTVARLPGSNFFTGVNTFGGGYILVPAGSQPVCNPANEGWFWYTKGSGSANGSFQICQNQSGVFQWVTH